GGGGGGGGRREGGDSRPAARPPRAGPAPPPRRGGPPPRRGSPRWRAGRARARRRRWRAAASRRRRRRYRRSRRDGSSGGPAGRGRHWCTVARRTDRLQRAAPWRDIAPPAMRSVWIPKAGPPEVLQVRDGPDPVPRAGETLIRVRTSGVNFADVAAGLGVYPDAPPFPCVVGYEVAGVVEQAPGADGLAPGQRVAALTRFGGYAETVAVPAAQVFPLPSGLSFEQGAAIPVNYLTAVLMLRHFGNVRAGDRVLVHAA